MTKEKIENYDDVLYCVKDAIDSKKLIFNNHANRDITLYCASNFNGTSVKATSSAFDNAVNGDDGRIYYNTDAAVNNIKLDNNQNYLVILSCAKDLAKHRYSKYLKDPASMIELIEQLPIKILAAIDPDMNESIKFSMLSPITPNYNADTDGNDKLREQFHRLDMGRVNSYFDQKIKQIDLTCKQMKEIWALKGQNAPIVYRYEYNLIDKENQLCFYNAGSAATEAKNAYRIFNETIARYATINLKPMFKDSQMYVLIKKGAGSWYVKYARKLNHSNYYNEMINEYANPLANDTDGHHINKINTSFIFDHLPLACFDSHNSFSFYNGYVGINDTDVYDARYKEIEFHSRYDLERFDSQSICGRSDWQLIDTANYYYAIESLSNFELDLPKFDSSLPYQLSQTDLLDNVVNSRTREYVDINPNETKTLPEIFNMISLANPRQKTFIENHTLVALLGTDTIKEIDTNSID